MRKVKDILLRMLRFVLIGVFLMATAEMAIRTFKPQITGPVEFSYDSNLGAIPVPNAHGRVTYPYVYDYTYSNNSLGLRGSKEYAEKKDSVFRILFLGDSFTYGIGVNDDETFPYLFEKNLIHQGIAAEIVNAGNPGKGTDYELRFF